jgi:hypothetical protein
MSDITLRKFPINIHDHARRQMELRGVSEDEIIQTITEGETFEAKYQRIGFRRNFIFLGIWQSKRYAAKQVELYTVLEQNPWLVISVILKYF